MRVINDQAEIRHYIYSYYKSLFGNTSTVEHEQDIFLSRSMPSLPAELVEDLERDVHKNEIHEALLKMPNGKTPGIDGLPAEFYKVFWDHISDLILKVFQEILGSNHLPLDMRRGYVSLIPKKDKDSRYVRNWRPISLLNTDYKILAKAMARRLKPTLPFLIHSDQKGFMSGRYIGENIRLVIEAMDHCEVQEQPGLLFFADFEKAYDSVDRRFLQKCMKAFGFGPNFCNWITIITSDPIACVLVNGYATDYFSLYRGLRQGCPLSCFLFLLCVEPLGIATRSMDIEGIRVCGQEWKISQFADDTTFFLNGSERSLSKVLDLLDSFSRVSGLKVNCEKSEALWIGSARNSASRLCPHVRLKWTEEPVRLLGVIVSPNTADIPRKNNSAMVNEVRVVLNLWSQRNLTTYGRCILIKSYGLSRMNFLASIIDDPPKELLDDIQKLIWAFLAKKGCQRIRRITFSLSLLSI